MSNAAETLEGWYCLNDFRKIDWKAWKTLSSIQRQEVLEETFQLWDQWKANDNKAVGLGVFQIIGHKADIMFMFLRPTLEELNQIEIAFNKTILADYTIQTSSLFDLIILAKFGNFGFSMPSFF
jgi:peroxiredoxin